MIAQGFGFKEQARAGHTGEKFWLETGFATESPIPDESWGLQVRSPGWSLVDSPLRMYLERMTVTNRGQG